jgi:hypothetical protein
MNTVENVNPDTLLRRYFANRKKFQEELARYRKSVSDLHFNEILINSLKRSLAIYPNESDTAWRIRREIQTLKEKRIDLNSIVKTRKQIMQVARVRTNKYVDLYEEVRRMNRLGEGKTTIQMFNISNDTIIVRATRVLETGEVKTFDFER